jgi:hypothetical protein
MEKKYNQLLFLEHFRQSQKFDTPSKIWHTFSLPLILPVLLSMFCVGINFIVPDSLAVISKKTKHENHNKLFQQKRVVIDAPRPVSIPTGAVALSFRPDSGLGL